MNGLLIFLFFVTVSTLSYMLGYHTRVKKDKPPECFSDIRFYKGSIVKGFRIKEHERIFVCELNMIHKGKEIYG